MRQCDLSSETQSNTAAALVGNVPAAELATYVIEKGKPVTQIEK